MARELQRKAYNTASLCYYIQNSIDGTVHYRPAPLSNLEKPRSLAVDPVRAVSRRPRRAASAVACDWRPSAPTGSRKCAARRALCPGLRCAQLCLHNSERGEERECSTGILTFSFYQISSTCMGTMPSVSFLIFFHSPLLTHGQQNNEGQFEIIGKKDEDK